jgi:hypothetical protein
MWIDEFLNETSFVETPKNWLWWSALATVSAVVAPKVYVNKGAYKIRPNLYILLMGRSGLGKGFGPSCAKNLVEKVHSTRIISGRGTIEAIIKSLSVVQANGDGSIPFKDARGFLVSGEFASSLYESSHALTILTDLYDGHYNKQWDNTLKNSPVEKLKDVCLTMLSGANQDMFNLTVDKHHMGGGFVGRTLLISADKRAQSNSMIYGDDDEIPQVDYDRLVQHLQKINKLEGAVGWTKSAKDKYNEWFYPYREADIEDKTGTYDRMNDHIIKVATCIGLARSTSMKLEAEDIELAIEACSDLSSTARKTAGMQGKSNTSESNKAVLAILFNAPSYSLTRKQVLQKGFGEFDSVELDKAVETLSQTGFITQPTGGKEIKYQVTKVAIDWWENSLKRKG